MAGGSDGNYPWAGVILDEAGNLYGTTVDGGDPDPGHDSADLYRRLIPLVVSLALQRRPMTTKETAPLVAHRAPLHMGRRTDL
jgi:hypothetical protein